MKDLLTFIVKKITASDEFEIEEGTEEGGRFLYSISASPTIMGMIIGKAGRNIKMIRSLAKIRAVIEGISVNVVAVEK